MTTICARCGETLTFLATRGWVHPEGGAYVMRCEACGWTGAPYPAPSACPSCGSRDGLRDDHCVLATTAPRRP